MGLFSSSTAPPAYAFFVIYFAERTVRAALWQVNGNLLEIVHASSQHPWLSDAELIDATDTALQELGQESEDVKQTLFALEPTWVTQQGILADRKHLFQQLTKELDLEAAGFVVIPEAIIQHVLYAYGQVFECFVVEVMSERVYVTQLKDGKLGQQEMVARSTNLVEDISEAFARFHDTSLPSALMLYSSLLSTEELQECSRRLLEIDLSSKYAFAGALTIETFDENQMLEIVVQTGGRAVAEARGLIGPADFTTQPAPDAETTAVEAGLEEPFLEAEQHPVQQPLGDTSAAPVEEFLPSTPLHSPAHSYPARDPFGQGGHDDRDGTLLFGRFHLPHHPVLFSVFGVVLGIILLAILFFFSSTRLLSAQVTIELKTNRLAKELALRLDPQAIVSDPVAGTLKAEVLKQTVTGSKEADTTGKKMVGEKAKGKVTIFNRTSSSKTLTAGTVLQSGSQKFLLDQSTTVASASTGRNFETNPGTVEANVTAAAIGSESNLNSDTELTIESFAKDTYIARATKEGIAGGTSREIKAVSQKDQDQLLIALKKELSEQAAKQLQSQVGDGKYVFPSNTIKVTSSKFSAEVGKEINSLSLDLTVEADALSYSSTELQQLAKQVLTQELPAGYALPSEGIEVLTQPATSATASAQVNIKAQIAAVARPTVEPNSWKQDIAGKSETEAKDILQQKAEVASVQVSRSPVLFAKFNAALPTDPNKITIQVR